MGLSADWKDWKKRACEFEDRSMEVEQNGTQQSSEIDPHTYGQIMSHIGYKKH